jgi:hypothetical protein
MALEGTVKLPGIGPVKKKTALIVGVGAPFLVLGVWWYRQRKASGAGTAAAAAGGMVTDPAGYQCATLNPATGYCPGTQADLNAQSIGAVNAGNAGEGLNGYYYGAGGVPGTMPGPGNFADNAEWVQYVIAYESDNGLNPNVAAVTVSLGLYVAGSPVTASQQADIETAISIAGQPPIPGASGFPPGINLQTTGSGTGTTPGTCGTGFTLSATQTGHTGEIAATGGAGWCEPVSTGGTGGGGTGGGGTGGGGTGGGGPGSEILTGGHMISYKNGTAVLGWKVSNPTPGGHLLVTVDGPGAAFKNFSRQIPANATTATIEALEPGHTYVAYVTPMGANGQATGGPNHITFVTK